MSKSALLIVDMIHDFTHPEGRVFYPQNREIIPQISKVLNECRKAGCTVIFMQHRYRKNKLDNNLLSMRPCCLEGTAGVEIDSDLTPLESEYIIPKRRYSAFYGTDLDLVLRENNVRNVIITGTKTNCCINATALDSYYRNYATYVVSDCVGTKDRTTNDIYLRDIDKYIGTVISSDNLIAKLREGVL